MDPDSIRDVLTEMGYSLRDCGKEYRTTPLYRESDNPTVLSIKKDSGRWVDFKESIGGSFEELVKLTLNLSSIEDTKKWLKNKGHVASVSSLPRPQVKTQRVFDKNSLTKLEKDHSYWISRGIDMDTIEKFSGGIMREGRMKNRYVFPIFNSKDILVGMTGRFIYELNNPKIAKWKHLGDKTEWKYPLQINHDIIKESKKIILVESVGDCLALWNSGIKNTMVIFGLNVSVPQLNTLLRMDSDKIVISLNNDSENNNAGNNAAEKTKKKLLKYFDSQQVQVALPTSNDFGDMSKQEIKEWKLKNVI
jgi:hypothetical protein